jgi:hypothetical protein
LPLLGVGNVFKNGVKVGDLPQTRHIITFRPGQDDSLEYLIGQEISKPPGWGGYPHKTFNPSEFARLFDHTKRNIFFSKSRLAVITRRRNKDQEIFVMTKCEPSHLHDTDFFS